MPWENERMQQIMKRRNGRRFIIYVRRIHQWSMKKADQNRIEAVERAKIFAKQKRNPAKSSTNADNQENMQETEEK